MEGQCYCDCDRIWHTQLAALTAALRGKESTGPALYYIPCANSLRLTSCWIVGYTPLHMAVGYSFVSTVRILLEAGANPEIPDSQARNVVQLVDSIRDSMPFNPQLAQKRIALEEVSAMLTGFVPCFSAYIGASIDMLIVAVNACCRNSLHKRWMHLLWKLSEITWQFCSSFGRASHRSPLRQ